MSIKQCNRCGETKSIEDFNHESRTRDGLATICRICAKEQARERYRRDPLKQRAASARWIAKDPERAAEMARKAALKYKYANLEKVRERQRVSDARRNRKDRIARRAMTHASRTKRRDNQLYKLYERCCSAISRAIKLPTYKGRQTIWHLLGYSAEELRAHLWSRFTPGMYWDNYGHGPGQWELDHHKPIAAFDPNTQEPEAIIRTAFALNNLQPLWTMEHRVKGSFWNGRHWTLKSHD